MGKEKTVTAGSFLQGMFQVGVYKRNQGRITRQVTFAAAAVMIALGAWRLLQFLIGQPDSVRYFGSGMLLLFGLWLGYRLVNYPRFADFLIAVEAEMNKVSWPTRTELWRSALVVIAVIFVMAVLLYFYDVFWVTIFSKVLGILKQPG